MIGSFTVVPTSTVGSLPLALNSIGQRNIILGTGTLMVRWFTTAGACARWAPLALCTATVVARALLIRIARVMQVGRVLLVPLA